jgi:hypothetical protein
VYKKRFLITPAEPPQLLAPAIDSDKTERRGHLVWGSRGKDQIGGGSATCDFYQPYLLMVGVGHKIAGMGLVER